MATDRIGIGHATSEVAGAMSSGTKREVEELVGHVLPAVVGSVVDRAISAAVDRYQARTSVEDQLQRLRTLAIMVHSAVEAAEGVHIRNWWLRRWLWSLRDAALDADEVLRLFRRRRAAEEAAAAGRQAAAAGTRDRNTLWSAAWRALRSSAKSLLFGGEDEDDGAIERLGRMVERLEREAMGLGDFLKMLELEIRRSLPVQSDSERRLPLPSISRRSSSLSVRPEEVALKHWEHMIRHYGRLSYVSHDEYVADVRKMGLRLVRQRIRRALLTRKPPVAPGAASRPLDPDSLRDMVVDIRQAVSARGSTGAEFHGGERCWLALWRGELQAVVDRAERVPMLAVPVDGAGGDGADVMTTPCDDAVGGGGLRSMARSVETAAAHLDAFVTLVGLAQRHITT